MSGSQAQLFPQESKSGLGRPNYLKCWEYSNFVKSGDGTFRYYGYANQLLAKPEFWMDRQCRWNSSAIISEFYDQRLLTDENDYAYNTFTFNLLSTQTGVISNSGWTQLKITGSRLWYDAPNDTYYLTPLVKTYNRTAANFGTGGSSGSRTAFWQWRGKANWAGLNPWQSAPPPGTPMFKVDPPSSGVEDFITFPSIKIEWS